jgi:hypothetical protein
MKHKEMIMDLGEMFVSEFVSDVRFAFSGLKFKTQLIWDVNLGCPVLSVQPPSDMMWGKYWYRSGINPQMVLDLRDVVKSIEEIIRYVSENDIASGSSLVMTKRNASHYKFQIITKTK